MKNFKELFKNTPAIIGMIHVGALPGTPGFKDSVGQVIYNAIREALLLRKAGVDGIMIENMHDVPYLKGAVGPEITSMMAVIGREVKNTSKLPCGMQILAGANREALAAAQSGHLDFIRAEGFVFGHVADEGWIEASAGDLLRYRKQIAAEDICVLTDIKKKHSSHAITADIDIVETAKTAEYFRSDGVIITGTSTGKEAQIEELREVKKAINIPVLVGSGVNIDNVEVYMEVSNAMIIGSWFKREGDWRNEVDPERVTAFMEKVNSLRN